MNTKKLFFLCFFLFPVLGRAELTEQEENFWKDESAMVSWRSPIDKIFEPDPTDTFMGKWFVGGKLNIAYNCVDRFAEKYPEAPAFVWVGINDSPETPEYKIFTYKELFEKTNAAANFF